MKFTRGNWLVLIALGAVAALYVASCASKSPPPIEMADELKLSPSQRAGMTDAELDAAFLRWTKLQDAKAAERDRETAAAIKKAELDAAARQAEAEQLSAETVARAAITLDGLEAEHRTRVAQLQLSTGKTLRQTTSDAQAAILAINETARTAGSTFRAFLDQQADKTAAVAGGVAAAKASNAQQDYLKTTLSSVGLQAATPYLPIGMAAVLAGLVGNVAGKRTGEANAAEPTRALLSAIKSAGVGEQVGRHIEAHAEPDDVAALARIGMKDNAAIPIARSAA